MSADELNKQRDVEQRAWDCLRQAVSEKGFAGLTKAERDLYYIEHIWGRVAVDGFHTYLFTTGLTDGFDFDVLFDTLDDHGLSEAIVCYAKANELFREYLLGLRQDEEADADKFRKEYHQHFNEIEEDFYGLEPQFKDSLYRISLEVLNQPS